MENQHHKFSKAEKLKSRKTIELLFSKGRSVNEKMLRAVYMQKDSIDGSLINVGFSVPKKNIKTAVKRNLIKRRMREAYRLNNQALKLQLKESNMGIDIMFVYTSKQILDYKDIEEKIKVILTRLKELGEVVNG